MVQNAPKTLPLTTGKWVVNGGLSTMWSPSYWRTEFFAFNMGRGLYWNGTAWLIGNWTIPSFSQADCQYYSGYQLR